MLGDLHCHSTCSDGGMTPGELFLLAKQKELSILAITDHDRLTATSELIAQASAQDLQLVPAVECSTKDGKTGRKVHLLCYFPKDCAGVTELCQSVMTQRAQKGLDMLELIQKHYLLPTDWVLRYATPEGVLFRQHLMRAMMDFGYTQQLFGEMFQHLFGKEGIARKGIAYPDTITRAKQLKECGGVLVLAHPYEYQSLGVMEELTKLGLLDGIEAKHSRCPQEGVTHLQQFAKEHGLLTTGGSDFHGFYCSRPTALGQSTTTEQEWKALLQRREENAK